MKIYLPWKTRGPSGKYHQATLNIEYSNAWMEDLNKSLEVMRIKHLEEIQRQVEKKAQGGLRKCPGHKWPKTPIYSADGMCSICGGFK